ncbi:MAG TPA: glycoside hydrolase family 3 N-terminal domain-containing protein [Steroidobacteraceae bacterium]|nr:glycoside hydrolase family 3 N-terminal domain-containing protein [Steroidobacteraceae bacterium]
MSRSLIVALASLAVLASLATLASPAAAAAGRPLYQDPSAPIEARVNDLLSRMTLQEKLAQISCIWQRKGEVEDANGNFDAAKASRLFPNGIGQVARPSDRVPLEANDPLTNVFRDVPQTVDFINAVQHYSVDDTRLGIPTLFHGEGLHGYMARDATSFPQAIALASSWDPALITRVYTVVAREARARGVQLLLTPVINLGRDPRWGRIEETFGEDPYIASRMGIAEVRGLQGESLPLGPGRVFATLKHMAGYGVPEAGTNVGPAEITRRTLLQMYLPAFHAAIREANAQVVMASYNEIGGIPSHANHWMLTDLLRKEWGFKGVVLSDYEGIEQLDSLHHVAGNLTDAAAMSLNAGVDDDMPDGEAFAHLPQALAQGKVTQAAIDTAVRRVLRLKFLAGLFEHPYADARYAEKITDDAEARALAVKAAQESIVLLKNDGTLPLSAHRIRTLAVIGPNAGVARLGGYSEVPAHSVSILQGIRNLLGQRVRVLYARGVKLVAHGDQYTDEVVLPTPAANSRLIQQAVRVAKSADEIVLAIGTRGALCREGWADNHLGDRDSLKLIDQQQQLADAMFALGKPVVVVLINGCPLAVDEIAKKANALIEGWYLGQEGGTAMADVLFGKTDPGGKLTVTIPRSVGFVPYNYDEKPSAHRGYQFADNSPLFPFGYGLSYTTFEVGAPVLSAASIASNGSVMVTVNVRNTGKVAGDEVVELYLHELVTSVTEPMKVLRGFKRVSLAPGASTRVQFKLGWDDFAIWDEHMRQVVEPGTFQIMAGPDSVDLKTATLEVTR